jgi:cytochrome P450
VWNILQNPAVENRLLEELRNVWATLNAPAPRYEVLERLPYLIACIMESLRLAHGVVSSMLSTPVGDIVVDGYMVPAGSNIAMAVPFVNLNPDVFRSPGEFRPERWLGG